MAAPHPGKWHPVLKDPINYQSDVILDTQQIAAHACVIYTPGTSGIFPWKVLFFYAGGRESNGFVQTRIWDPNKPGSAPSSQNIPDWPSGGDDPLILCCGFTQMSDGKIITAGGVHNAGTQEPPHPPNSLTIEEGLVYTYIFDPTNELNPWSIAGGSTPHPMADRRLYPTLTQLGVVPPGTINGKFVVMSGWIADTNQAVNPQYYDEINGWSYFSAGATQPFQLQYDYYPSAHLIPSGPRAGHIFYSIPMEQAQEFNPFAGSTGIYWTAIGQPRTNHYRLNGTSTLLPLLPPYTSAKVLIIGGAVTYDDDAFNSAEVIDIASPDPQWTLMNNFLFFARKNHVSINLPNDMLLVVGGNLRSLATLPVYSAELVDTSNLSLKTTMLPGQLYPRGHHLTALLLPDATVWVSGSGGVDPPNQFSIEIYEPGYLFEGERPVINSAPPSISYGTTFDIQTSVPVASQNGIRLIRLGTVTHSTDMSQLSVGLEYVAGGSENTYTVTPPPNANIAPPGLYMLFVLRDKSQSLSGQTMIPSVAKIVLLQ